MPINLPGQVNYDRTLYAIRTAAVTISSMTHHDSWTYRRRPQNVQGSADMCSWCVFRDQPWGGTMSIYPHVSHSSKLQQHVL